MNSLARSLARWELVEAQAGAFWLLFVVRSQSAEADPVARAARNGVCPSELQDVVGQADQAPFRGDLLHAAQKELTKAARLLDLSEHRLGQLLS